MFSATIVTVWATVFIALLGIGLALLIIIACDYVYEWWKK